MQVDFGDDVCHKNNGCTRYMMACIYDALGIVQAYIIAVAVKYSLSKTEYIKACCRLQCLHYIVDVHFANEVFHKTNMSTCIYCMYNGLGVCQVFIIYAAVLYSLSNIPQIKVPSGYNVHRI